MTVEKEKREEDTKRNTESEKETEGKGSNGINRQPEAMKDK